MHLHLPTIPKRPPRDTCNDLVWEPPEPEPKSPPFAPMAAAQDVPIDLGRSASRIGQQTRDAKAPSFDDDNRNVTILDAIWTAAGELVSGPATEAARPLGSIILVYWSYFKTVSEGEAQAAQDSLLTGVELGIAGALLAGTLRQALVVPAARTNQTALLRFIAADKTLQGLNNLWHYKRVRPWAETRRTYSDKGLAVVVSALARAVSSTQYLATLSHNYTGQDAKTREAYLHQVRIRTYIEFSRACTLQFLKAKDKVSRP